MSECIIEFNDDHNSIGNFLWVKMLIYGLNSLSLAGMIRLVYKYIQTRPKLSYHEECIARVL